MKVKLSLSSFFLVRFPSTYYYEAQKINLEGCQVKYLDFKNVQDVSFLICAHKVFYKYTRRLFPIFVAIKLFM